MKRLHLFSLCCLTSTVLCTSTAFAAPTTDAEIQALKAQLRAVTERLATIEQERAHERMQVKELQRELKQQAAQTKKPLATQTASASGDAVTAGAMPNSFKLPGTDTSIKLGGFVKLDAITDVNKGYGGQFANFSTIPLDGSAQDNQDGEFNAHARSTRVNLTTLTPTEVGNLKTFVEFDFFGADRGNPNTTNGYEMRLRHAYGEVGNVLAGQTWSNFLDLAAYPESLDFIGPAGLTFVRQAQLRYTDSIDDNWSYAVALESPHTGFTATSGLEADLSQVPDLTGRLVYKDDFGHLAFRGLARQLNATNTATGVEDEAFGWGLGLSGRINTFGKDNVAFQGVYGDGLGHYLLEVAVGRNGNTYVNNELEPQVAYGGYVSYQHHWSEDWRTNIMGGYTGIDNDISRTGLGVNKEIMSGHVNLIWNPTPNYKVGLEYMHGYRELESGAEGDLDRVQASFVYNF